MTTSVNARIPAASTAGAEPASPPTGEGTPHTLALLHDLFDRLDRAGIRYCHWKSNEHLRATMTGATDVDILVDRRAAQRLAHLLTEDSRFKRFAVRAGRGYPGIEDYVGFDQATGTLSHLHVHYQLTLGEKFLKGHRLPWEDVVLATRVRDPASRAWVTDPHLELLILVARAALKLRWRDFPLAATGTAYLRGSMLRELQWLAARVTPAGLVERATALVGADAAHRLAEIAASRSPSIHQVRAFRRAARPRLSAYRMYTAFGATRRMWTREWTWIWWRARNFVRHAPTKSTRTPPQGGLMVALVGPDGAGKSTVTRAIARWLSREIAVITTYAGSGSGSASAVRRSLQGLGALFLRRPKAAGRRTVAAQGESASGLRLWGKVLWTLSLARERRGWAARVRAARSLGMIVLSDRLPQSQFAGLNDGPRLGHWRNARSPLRRFAARRERAAFQLAELVPPDLVLRLQLPMELAARRKPDTPLDQLRRKVEIVAQLEFPPTTRVVEIDASQPLDQVLIAVKRAVWEAV